MSWEAELLTTQHLVAALAGLATSSTVFALMAGGVHRLKVAANLRRGPAARSDWQALARKVGLERLNRRQANLGGLWGFIGQYEVCVAASERWTRDETRFEVALPARPDTHLAIEPRAHRPPSGADPNFGALYLLHTEPGVKPSQMLSAEVGELFVSFARDGIPLHFSGDLLSFRVGGVGLDTDTIERLLMQLMAAASLLHRHLDALEVLPDRPTVQEGGGLDDDARHFERLASSMGLEVRRFDPGGIRELGGHRGPYELSVTERPRGRAAAFINTLGVPHLGHARTIFRVILPRDSGFGLRVRPTLRGAQSPLSTGDVTFDLLYAVTTDNIGLLTPTLEPAIRKTFADFGRDGFPITLHGRFLSAEVDHDECDPEEIAARLEELFWLGRNLVNAFETANKCREKAPWLFEDTPPEPPLG